ncbi:hypothetical protein P5719_001620 [Lactobacillus amylovorus]|uniref:hypothetical protein n=1 Tax=Lactobacillus amylovorus TaxID=1604 RepID=UPI00313CCF15|nr:hypothetical protein [Lactobacillus amylovorus]
MIKAEIDITEPMESFCHFAKVGDMSHAMDAIAIISQKTSMKPSTVLDQIIEATAKNERYKEYDMACQILALMENERMQYKSRAAKIETVADDAKYCLDEIKKSGNPAVIRNFIEAVRSDLKQIESVL